jgi:hypothetical protein
MRFLALAAGLIVLAGCGGDDGPDVPQADPANLCAWFTPDDFTAVTGGTAQLEQGADPDLGQIERCRYADEGSGAYVAVIAYPAEDWDDLTADLPERDLQLLRAQSRFSGEGLFMLPLGQDFVVQVVARPVGTIEADEKLSIDAAGVVLGGLEG